MQVIKRDPDPLFDAFPGIETERLVLRKLLVSDAPDLFHMLSELQHFLVVTFASFPARACGPARWHGSSTEVSR